LISSTATNRRINDGGEHHNVARAGGQPPQRQSAPFEDFGVRRRAAVRIGFGGR